MQTSSKPLKVFLCHASADKPMVRALYKRLVEDSIDAWLDQEKLLPGQLWQTEIPQAVRNSDVVIVCLSKNSVNKEGYVQREIRFALDRAEEKLPGTLFIIPARLEDCEVPDRLTIYQWVDLFHKDGYNRLMRSLAERAKQLDVSLEKKTATDNAQKEIEFPQELPSKLQIDIIQQPKSEVNAPTSKSRPQQGLLVLGILLIIAVMFALISNYASKSPFSLNNAITTSTAAKSPDDIKIITIFLYNENNNPILNDAIVKVEGAFQQDDDDDGGFYLQSCVTGQYILVSSPLYETSREPCTTGKREYSIKLTRLISTISWVSAQNCRECHSVPGGHDEYSEWADHDGHSTVFTDQFFGTMYTGTNIFGNPGSPTNWETATSGQTVRTENESAYGPGYLLDYPNDQGNCAYCHVPALIQGSAQTGSVGDLIQSYSGSSMDPRTEGITCDICHKVKDVVLGENGLPYSDRPGVLSLSPAFPIDGKRVVLGPSVDPIPVPDTTMMCSPVFSEGKFCAACHYGKFFDTLIYNSYGEWLESGYSVKETNPEGTLVTENENYRSCQDCHMLSDQEVRGTPISARDACSSNKSFHDFDHNMMKYVPNPKDSRHEKSTLIEGAAILDVKYQYLAPTNSFEIITVVENTKAGHKLPTDSPLRHLLLVVQVTDEQDNMLPLVDGDTIPLWGGVNTDIKGMENYGGMPGKVFAHLLADKDTNESPTAAYWNPTKLAWVNNGTGQTSDNRLKPFDPDESRYSFAIPSSNGKVSITVKLVYRYAFIDLAEQKGWTRPDIIVGSVQCIVNIHQTEILECH